MKSKRKKIITPYTLTISIIIALTFWLLLIFIYAAYDSTVDHSASTYGYVSLQSGETIEGNVDSYERFENGRIDIVIDGVEYSTYNTNVTIVTKYD
jgi:hypothetical protein